MDGRGAVVAWLVGVALAPQGCAARATLRADEAGRLARRLSEFEGRLSARDDRVEELNQRVFLLEDMLDTTRVALQRRGGDSVGEGAPRLPVVRIGAPAAADGPGDGEQAPAAAPVRAAAARSGPSDDRGAARDTRRILDDPSPEVDDLAFGAATASAESRPETLVASEAVAYGGAALRGGPRPLLRLHGAGGSGRGQAARDPGEAMNLAAVDETLPVVPVARRPVVHAAARTSDGEAMHLYQGALASYRAGQPAKAALGFREFVRRHGQHAYADNALYWLGECLYDQKLHAEAQKVFRRVIAQYPGGNKAPDALLKLAYSYLALGDQRQARVVLTQVTQTYPQSEVAQLAARRLSALR
ncbi:MAG: tol-pal system protein YbgF [Proteobacteria bacterium]|nr:tol-pal system protein YbgF [Pseudomonadota bacterium]